jgi:hypothetical protein
MTMFSQASLANQPSPHLTRNARIIVIVVVVFAIVIAVLLLKPWLPADANRPAPHTENRVLLNGTITVNAGSYVYYNFTIPSIPNGYKFVNGNFSVLNGNSIRVYIMNETSFNNLKANGFKDGTYYDSGQVATGVISTNNLIEGATYFLVYDNSLQTSLATVTTEVNLIFWIF